MKRTVLISASILLALVVHTDSQAGQGTPAPPQAAAPRAKIVAMSGQVERAPDQQDVWSSARLFDALYEENRVRTFTASRAAILFLDETQVKLNADAILTVRTVRTGSGNPTTLNLLRGEGWFRTKNPASGLTIRTPNATAAMRGTEINLAIAPDGATVLTVVEGAVDLSNDAGALVVNAGEEGTARPGQTPTKRVILNPDDAVQWALYYPGRVVLRDLPAAALGGGAQAGFAQLRAGDPAAALAAFQPLIATDPWAGIGASIAYLELGNPQQARVVLAGAPADQATAADRHAQLAATALAVGDAVTARAEIDAALAIDRSALRALSLLSTLELTQNHADKARQAAEDALAAHPDSVAGLLAASEAAQALFDLATARRHLDRALTLDPADVAARVNRARLRFGTGDTNGARNDMEEATRLSPRDPQVLSLAGFILLGDGDASAARQQFDAAVAADPELGEPHLGLGLVHFRERRESDGLLEMLTATLLEPKVSLYQSYLGKAYYQTIRFPEGLSALATAKRLDPRDPTPWLYTSLFLRDQNRQVDALAELRHAISLNDNRAVYRSRLLLDRDLATKNVSLAQIYNQLGFAAWGAFEAQNSLDADFTNASAHLFLADTYGRLADRTQALGSELLQYFLYTPVNRNSFNNFNEYTALLEQPGRQLAPLVGWGTDGQATGRFLSRSGNERLAHVASIDFQRETGERTGAADEVTRLFLQAKYAFTPASDLFVFFNGSREAEGQSPEIVRTIGLENLTPVVLRQFVEVTDHNRVNRFKQSDLAIGFKQAWRPGSTFTAVARITRYEQITENPDGDFAVCGGIPLEQFGALSTNRQRFPFRSYTGQVQQAVRAGRHQVIFGAQLFTQKKRQECTELVYDALDQTPLGEFTRFTRAYDRTATGYVQDEIEVAPWLHLTAGLRYENVLYGDMFNEESFQLARLNPIAGAAIRLAPTTTLRIAAFRNVNSDFTGSKLSPSAVSGFVVDRNEFPTAIRKEAAISLERGWSRTFAGVRAFLRDTKVPALLANSDFLPDADTRALGHSGFVNLIMTPRVSLFADDTIVRINAPSFDRTDGQARIGLNFIHERGFFARVATGYINQRFSNTVVPGLPRSSFVLTDLEFSYEFGGKRGLFTLGVTNAFDRTFQTVVEGLSVERPLPDRRGLATFRWRILNR